MTTYFWDGLKEVTVVNGVVGLPEFHRLEARCTAIAGLCTPRRARKRLQPIRCSKMRDRVVSPAFATADEAVEFSQKMKTTIRRGFLPKS